uniref:Putative secreted protein n=1 Tax=Anopheles darlingi TaxID=43151 RepID=A0A2M4DHC1_ANODA
MLSPGFLSECRVVVVVLVLSWHLCRAWYLAMYFLMNSRAFVFTDSVTSSTCTVLSQCFSSFSITKCVNFRARCLKSSVFVMRPIGQFSFR